MAHPPAIERRAYTPRECAELLGVSLTTIYRLIQRGDLPARRLGTRTYRILRDDFERFIASDDWSLA